MALDPATVRRLKSQDSESITHPAGKPTHLRFSFLPPPPPPRQLLPSEQPAAAVWGFPPPSGSATPAGSPQLTSVLTLPAQNGPQSPQVTGSVLEDYLPPTADTYHKSSLSPVARTRRLSVARPHHPTLGSINWLQKLTELKEMLGLLFTNVF